MGEQPTAKLLLTNTDMDGIDDDTLNLNEDMDEIGSDIGIYNKDDNDDDTYTTSQMIQKTTTPNGHPNKLQFTCATSKAATNNGEQCVMVNKTPQTNKKNFPSR